jgi:MFS family permease
MPPESIRNGDSHAGPKPNYDEERETDLPAGHINTKPEIDNKDKDLVKWADGDPANPYNWAVPYKAFVTFQLGMLALAASLGSSILSPAGNTIAQVMEISEEVAVLNISLYILGFCFGPLLWGPLSELWGRRVSLIPAMFCLGCFSIGTAVSRNPQDIFITRFFGGVFGSAPVSNVSAAMGDIYGQETRGMAITFYAIMVVGGPTLGPLIGSAILVNPHLGWRWIAYILAIWVFAVAILALFCLPEVYGPVLLSRKAKKLRKSGENPQAHHPHEEKSLSPSEVVTKHLSRPLRMLFTEPMVMSIALYASFVYGLLYLTLEVFPLVYAQQRHWKPVPASLPFLGLFVGVLCAVGINLGNQPRYIRASRAAGGGPVPEARCPPIVLGGILFCIGLFWFGWTASPEQGVHWSSSVIATAFIGAGFNSVFQQCINVLVDTYGIYAASAVSANTFLRSMLAAGFPLVARPMFNKLGVGPAMSILGAVAGVLIPVPFLLMRYGQRLRKRSAFARQLEEKRTAS